MPEDWEISGSFLYQSVLTSCPVFFYFLSSLILLPVPSTRSPPVFNKSEIAKASALMPRPDAHLAWDCMDHVTMRNFTLMAVVLVMPHPPVS